MHQPQPRGRRIDWILTIDRGESGVLVLTVMSAAFAIVDRVMLFKIVKRSICYQWYSISGTKVRLVRGIDVIPCEKPVDKSWPHKLQIRYIVPTGLPAKDYNKSQRQKYSGLARPTILSSDPSRGIPGPWAWQSRALTIIFSRKFVRLL